MTDILCLDLETALDPAIRWKPKTPDAFPPPPCWRVAVAGMFLLSADLVPQKLGCADGDSEAEILANVAKTIDGREPVLVTFNGRGFDVPVLVARGMAAGIPMRWAFARDFRNRYSGWRHVDLADQLADHGAAPRVSLDGYASLIDAQGKGDVDGSSVAELLAAGRLDLVKKYCEEDCVRTALLYVRWMLVQGSLPRARAQQAEAAIRAFAAEHGKAVAA